jgi:transcriptional regulator with XRE-family HTH domain
MSHASNRGYRKEPKMKMTALRKLRLERGLSQDDLGRRIPEVSTSTLRAMDRGDHMPNARTLIYVARALNVSVEELLEGMDLEDPVGVK